MAGSRTTLYNRNEVQKSVKGKDGNTYWIGPKKHTTIPTTVDSTQLPKGVRLSSSVLANQPPNR
jgi:hypothetical protein